MALPERRRWADTEDGMRIIAEVRASLRRRKAAGQDVGELEDYLDAADPTPGGMDLLMRALLKKIDDPWPGRPGEPECPKCFAELSGGDRSCPSCGYRFPRPGPAPSAAPAPDHCPECKGRLGPDSRKCPICSHRLKPWKLFG